MRSPVRSLVSDTRTWPDIVVDTNVIFGAILYPDGNERQLFNLSETLGVPIVILDYVEEELRRIFKKKGLDFALILDFLDTYANITFVEIGEISDEIARTTRRTMKHINDRPIFAYVLRCLTNGENAVIISGDNHFHSKNVIDALSGKVYYPRAFLHEHLRR